jgi:hypothetical protein
MHGTLRSHRRSGTLAAAGWLVAAGALGAPPMAEPAEPHGPIDPCTVANFQETDVLCELCPPATKDAGACGKRLGGLGYQKKCETRQELAEHGEVWCKTKRAVASAKSEPEETRSTLRLVVLLAGAALVAVGLYFRRDWAKRGS